MNWQGFTFFTFLLLAVAAVGVQLTYLRAPLEFCCLFTAMIGSDPVARVIETTMVWLDLYVADCLNFCCFSAL